MRNEIDRIFSLPIIGGYDDFTRNLVTQKFPGKTIALRRVQTEALYAIDAYRGGFFPLGVGHGKTIISVLASYILGSRRSLLFIPPNVVDQLVKIDIPQIKEEFNVEIEIHSIYGLSATQRGDMVKHNGIIIFPYSLLSQPDAIELLEAANPDLVVADECHFLRYRSSARTRRLINFLSERPKIKFICLSGTITKKSIMDYHHLIRRCLGENSPLPKYQTKAMSWAEDIDQNQPFSNRFCRNTDIIKLAGRQGISRIPIEQGRNAFKVRMNTAPGVIASSNQSVDCSIYINPMFITVPYEIKDHLKKLQDEWVDPNGDEISDQIVQIQRMSQLSSGFYYRLYWPVGIPKWVKIAHKNKMQFHRELRTWLLRGKRKGFDTPMLAMKGLKNRKPYLNELQLSYDTWKGSVHGEEIPRESETIWESKYKITEVLKWAEKEETGIIWFKHDAMGKLLNHIFDLECKKPFNYCPASCKIESLMETGKIIIASVAHGTGKNLQHYHKNLIVDVPRSGGVMEQLMGRTHRQGQKNDEVTFDILCGTEFEKKGLLTAVRDAKYIQDTGAGEQKLLIANWTHPEYFLKEIKWNKSLNSSGLCLA